MQTYEADMIDSATSDGKTPDLDSCCKRIMSSKQIIAKVLQAVVPEYVDCETDEILKLIENVSVSETPVDADITAPVIISESNEDNSINEGKRIYDIKFTARTPKNQHIAIIINIEIQNNFNAGYPLIKRAEYYCARLISSQLNTVFTNSHYEKIEKIYSIWICTSPDEAHKNTISLYKMNRINLLGDYKDTEQDILDYDLINVIMICWGESRTKKCKGIIRMLHSLLVAEIPASEKKRIAHDEFGIPMNKEFDREVENMCNISTMYVERGINKGALEKSIKMILSLFKQNVPVEIIANAADLSVEETKKIIEENT